MDPHLSSHVHAAAAAASAFPDGKKLESDVLPPGVVTLDVEAGAPTNAAGADPRDGDDGDAGFDYMARAQWLRAAVLGANDGLVSVASLMIGIGWRVPTGHPAIPSHPTNLPRLMNAQLPPLAPGHGPGPPRVRGSMIITLAAEGRARGGG